LITSEEGEFSIEKCSMLNGTITSTTGSLLISNSTADILDKIEGSLGKVFYFCLFVFISPQCYSFICILFIEKISCMIQKKSEENFV
jgi:hypothetical protein